MAKGFSVKTNTSPEYYKIEEQVTTGWEIIETNLTKEECKEQYDALIGDGVSPRRIRITRIQ
tara:strand:+ start:400 stop:585 length:186 start_codon:yes stop_codon:yes gene_type:complete